MEAGLDQAQLAAAVGIDRPAITHYERGDYGCRIGMLHQLANALGCKPTELMLPQGDDADEEAGPEGAGRPEKAA